MTDKPSLSQFNRLILFILMILMAGFLSACDLVSEDPIATGGVTPSSIENENQILEAPAEEAQIETISVATLVPTAEIPTPSPEPILEPTAEPTIDPNLPQWTVLIYMAADNDLDPQAIFNLNQLESSGSSEEVNVVVQIDRAETAAWTNTRRYFIERDEDPLTVTSPIVEELGELNTGEASTLADFIKWGRENYPANNTALILWNHGIGWSGIATDETDRNILTLPELEQAFIDAEIGPNDLAMVGFDACLMGQLDVYAALAPFASVAVASEELTPARGWPYDVWLQSLLENPSQTPAELGTQTVTQFNEQYSQSHPFSTMAAVDLSQIDQVVTSFEEILATTNEDLTIASSDLILARDSSEEFARAYGIESGRFAAIDLGHFSSLLKTQAVNEDMRQQAVNLENAIQSAVISSASGSGFSNASGIALYFPGDQLSIDPRYEVQSSIPAWSSSLTSIITENAANLTLPSVTIATDSLNQTASVLNPLYLEFQLTGRQIESVNLVAGRYLEESGRRELLEIDPLRPEPTYLADGSQSFQWRDGLHEDFYVWSTKVTFLSDGTNGQFVIMWPLDEANPATNLRTVAGTYYDQATGQNWRANVVFDTNNRQIQQAWATGGGGAPYEFTPRQADQFQPDQFFLDDEDNIITEPGVLLVLGEGGQLSYTWEGVEPGNYFIGFEAQNAAGTPPMALIDISVENPVEPPPWQAYLDPYLGFQFLYPTDWYRPVYNGDRLFTTSPTGDATLQVIVFPDLVNPSAELLLLDALDSFGLNQSNILYRDNSTIDNRPAERIAYGYFTDSGQRVGQLTAFVRDGVGFVIDLDGPAESEEQTIEIWDRLIENWAYLPVGRGLFPNRWATMELTELELIQPDTFVYEPASAGWERFSLPDDSRIFMALHVDPLTSEDTPQSLLDRWTTVAQSGVDEFALFEPATRRFALGGRLWFRRDFSYVDGSGDTIWGFLMVTQDGNRLITAWTEAPQGRYVETESAVFEVMLAELQTIER